MPQPFLQLGEWTPDNPDLQSAVPNQLQLAVASGVYARPDVGYGPLPNCVTFSTNAMAARCQGAYSTKSKAQVISTFGGTATKLYQLQSNAWVDVSKVGGYTIAAADTWEFEKFGESVIAVNIADAPQAWTLDSSSAFADLGGSPPKARFVRTIEPGFLMFGYCDLGAGVRPNYLRWSAINDPTDWPTLGTADAASKQSDNQELAFGGDIMGIVAAVGGAQGAVFCQTAIWRIDYIQAPAIFRFTAVEDARGTRASNSIIKAGQTAFYLGNDGFYAFDGSRSIPIGHAKVDQFFLSEVDITNLHRVYGVYDDARDLMIWAYPGPNAVNGNPNRWLVFAPGANRWTYSDDAAAQVEFLFRGQSGGYTLDGLDSIVPDIDLSDVSFDSPAYFGGSPLLSGITTAHELCYFNGAAIAGRIETGEYDGGQGRRMRVQGVRPLVDGGTLTTQIGYRDQQDAVVNYSAVTSPSSATGICPHRVDARYIRSRINIAAAGTWQKAFGLEVLGRPGGKR